MARTSMASGQLLLAALSALLFVLGASAASAERPCVRDMELCQDTEYRAYVNCLAGRKKRSLCTDGIVDCSDGRCKVVDPVPVKRDPAADVSCIGTNCDIRGPPPLFHSSTTTTTTSPISLNPTVTPVISDDTCAVCPPNVCGDGRCRNPCDDTCCVTECLKGCRSDICYGKCLSLCGKEAAIAPAAPPQQQPQLPQQTPIDIDKIVDATSDKLDQLLQEKLADAAFANASPNSTTIIRLVNVVNETEADPPPKNLTAAEEAPRAAEEERREERCCVVVQRRKCRRAGAACGDRKHRSCGDHCTADVMRAHADADAGAVTYVPEPRPRCAYRPAWPYVACGRDAAADEPPQRLTRADCAPCRSAHKKGASGCGACGGAGGYPPVWSPFGASPMMMMMMPVLVPVAASAAMPPSRCGARGGCGGSAGDGRRIVMVSDSDVNGDNDNPSDENSILPHTDYVGDLSPQMNYPQFAPYNYYVYPQQPYEASNEYDSEEDDKAIKK